MKRSMWIAALVFAGILALGLGACGNGQGSSDAASDSSTSASSSATSSDSSASAAGDGASVSSAASSGDEASSNAESDAAASPSSASYTPGSITDGSYANRFFGFKFSAPEGWAVLDAETLAETLGDSASSMEYVANSAEGDNVNIMVDTTDVALQGATDPSAYTTLALDPIKAALESQGAEAVSAAAGTASLAGQDYPSIDMEYTFQETPVKQRSVIVEKDGYTAVVTITAVSAELDDILQHFSKL